MCIEYKSICNTSELLYLMPQGMAREGTGGWGRNEMEWGDGGGSKGGNRENWRGEGTATLLPLLVLRPGTLFWLTLKDMISTAKCSLIIKSCLEPIFIISVARCHDKIKKFTTLK